MKFTADLHIHSHYSIATSKESNPIGIGKAAAIKGIDLIGSGDITHPAWRSELKEKLQPAGDGIFRLKETYEKEIKRTLPSSVAGRHVFFILTGEISSIYKKNGQVRKIHNLVMFPSFDRADAFAHELEKRKCNIRSDGRPIIGIEAKNLLEIYLSVCPEGMFIPAHIWTPHFSLFGDKSGFDTIEECFEGLSTTIHAVETGLSSDPAMNWRLSALDRMALVSNSDAHSPAKLAREANIFDTEMGFTAIRDSLQKKDHGFLGTIEFFPEEGKYHFNGHRKCTICMSPTESIKADNICPVCGKKMTIGVHHRVLELADREDPERPEGAASFTSLVPLREIIADLTGSAASKKTSECYDALIENNGPELDILLNADISTIAENAGDMLAEGIHRVRTGAVKKIPGYDGEYGRIVIFNEKEKNDLKNKSAFKTHLHHH
ncbi:endonuclease Q family protein [Spirochaetota bacterium]